MVIFIIFCDLKTIKRLNLLNDTMLTEDEIIMLFSGIIYLDNIKKLPQPNKKTVMTTQPELTTIRDYLRFAIPHLMRPGFILAMAQIMLGMKP